MNKIEKISPLSSRMVKSKSIPLLFKKQQLVSVDKDVEKRNHCVLLIGM